MFWKYLGLCVRNICTGFHKWVSAVSAFASAIIVGSAYAVAKTSPHQSPNGIIAVLQGLPGAIYFLAALGTVLLVRIFMAPFWVFEETAKQRDELEFKADDKAKRLIEASELSKLVSKAAVIYKQAIGADGWNPSEKITEWKNEVAKTISKFDRKSIYIARLEDAESKVSPAKRSYEDSIDFNGAYRTKANRLRAAIDELRKMIDDLQALIRTNPPSFGKQPKPA
jgi:hypothetical protein